MHKEYSCLRGFKLRKFITFAYLGYDNKDYISNGWYSYGDGKGYVVKDHMKNGDGFIYTSIIYNDLFFDIEIDD